MWWKLRICDAKLRICDAQLRIFGGDLRIFGPNWRKQVEIEGVGPIWRDPRRNSAEFGLNIAQNGGMATYLVQILCGLGSLGVPGPASTP